MYSLPAGSKVYGGDPVRCVIVLPCKGWFKQYEIKNPFCRMHLQCAGRILDLNYVEIDLHYPRLDEQKRIAFSSSVVVLPLSRSSSRAEILVVGCTCGDRFHKGRLILQRCPEFFIVQFLVNSRTMRILVFMSSRARELLYGLDHLKALHTSDKGQVRAVALDSSRATARARAIG